MYCFRSRNQHISFFNSPGLEQLLEEQGRLIVEIWSRNGGGIQAKQREELVSISQGMEDDILVGIGSVPVNILLQVRMAYRPA